MISLEHIGSRYSKVGFFTLRFGLAATFLLFAIQKLKMPGQGSAEIQLLFPFLSFDQSSLVNFITVIFEFLVVIALVTGFKLRLAGLFGGLFITTIIVSNLYWSGLRVSDGIYRDFGLVGASLFLFFLPRLPKELSPTPQQ